MPRRSPVNGGRRALARGARNRDHSGAALRRPSRGGVRRRRPVRPREFRGDPAPPRPPRRADARRERRGAARAGDLPVGRRPADPGPALPPCGGGAPPGRGRPARLRRALRPGRAAERPPRGLGRAPRRRGVPGPDAGQFRVPRRGLAMRHDRPGRAARPRAPGRRLRGQGLPAGASRRGVPRRQPARLVERRHDPAPRHPRGRATPSRVPASRRRSPSIRAAASRPSGAGTRRSRS